MLTASEYKHLIILKIPAVHVMEIASKNEENLQIFIYFYLPQWQREPDLYLGLFELVSNFT